MNRQIKNSNMEQAPIVNQRQGRHGTETNFKGAGYSHFSHVQNKGFHTTTHVPGTGVNNLRIHNPVNKR